MSLRFRLTGGRAAAALLALGAALPGCGSSRSGSAAKVIVLGVDGMDPGFVEQHWDALPNLKRLRDAGEFKRLATTTPPQSPVAWATFATGLNPSEHGIYDFVHRNPSSLEPFSSLAEVQAPRHILTLGPWRLPLSKGEVRSFRRGRTFWEVLGARGIAVKLVRMPGTYPAPRFAGTALAGMGVPDLRGSYGTFTLYTDNPFDATRDVPGGRIVQVSVESGSAMLRLDGPPDSLRRDGRTVSVDLRLEVDPAGPVARVSVAGQQFLLRQGEWSDWVHVRFPLMPLVAEASGMFRVYAGQLHPGLRLYVSPINIDPASPDLPIAWPEEYSKDLERDVGPFYTQGIREDTAALRAGALSLEEYLVQSRAVFEEDLALLHHSLREFRSGLLFFYFSSIDQNSHMLWGEHREALLETYRAVDAAVGEVAAHAPDATLIVMSDHGFTSFREGVNLNTWLLERGYLKLKAGGATPVNDLAQRLEWSQTKAYAIGLNALYLNLFGRERNGCVRREAADQLVRTLSAELLAWRDPATGGPVITAVDRPAEQLSRYAPDLIVGYAPGYRASWGGSLGEVEPAALEKNHDAWIGDHCVDPRGVPGVLFANRRSAVADPELKDLTVTLLHLFGVAAEPPLAGRAIY